MEGNKRLRHDFFRCPSRDEMNGLKDNLDVRTCVISVGKTFTITVHLKLLLHLPVSYSASVMDGYIRINENVRGTPVTADGHSECSNLTEAFGVEGWSSNGSAATVNVLVTTYNGVSFLWKHKFSIHTTTFRLHVLGQAMIKLCLDGPVQSRHALLHNLAIHLSTLEVTFAKNCFVRVIDGTSYCMGVVRIPIRE